LFPPQSEQSKAELHELSSLKNHIVGGSASKSTITIVQDCLLGNYLMTNTDEEIPQEDFFQMCMALDKFDMNHLNTKLETVQKVYQKFGINLPLYCGKSLFSLLLPTDFIYQTDNGVKIYNGVLYAGAITKMNLGSNHYSIVRLLEKEYGADVCMGFINDVQFVANAYIMYHGFSVGISDCITDKQVEIQNVIARSMLEAEGYEQNTVNPNICEARVTMALGKARDVGMKIAKDSLSSHNRFLDTVTSGSKGDFFNIAQIMGLLGQQNVSGQRIQCAVSKNSRILPHYPLEGMDKATEYESKGFIKHSFIQGLNPQEFWNHASTGREGVTDKIVSVTADYVTYVTINSVIC
jgi:DNA-directed RNA polymerase II subunit RPB1